MGRFALRHVQTHRIFLNNQDQALEDIVSFINLSVKGHRVVDRKTLEAKHFRE